MTTTPAAIAATLALAIAGGATAAQAAETPKMEKIGSLGISLQVFNPRFFTFSNMSYFG